MGMPAADLSVLALVAFLTSALTATVGMGGGVILIAVMVVYWEPLLAIPLHGAVQLVSNGSRAIVQREHVRWSVLAPFALLLLPAGALGLWAATSVPADAVRASIGVFVLLALWAPRALLLGVDPGGLPEARRFFLLGGVTGFLNTTVGASGPLQGPFYRGIGLTRHGIVGTFAACQVLGHTVKIALFVAAGFSLIEHAPALLLLGSCVLAGTLAGSRLLDRVSEPVFRGLYKVTLTLLALRLAVWEPFIQPLLG